jgi:hypothetical protein
MSKVPGHAIKKKGRLVKRILANGGKIIKKVIVAKLKHDTVNKKTTQSREFQPNVSPSEMFKLGVFGGTYWRPIFSSVIGENLARQHEEFRPLGWWDGISAGALSSSKFDPTKNHFGVKAGSSLDDWESKHWIVPQDPYGWVQWYCRYVAGRRSPDDQRQIQRWLNFAGPKGRFRRNVIKRMREAHAAGGDWKIVSPVIQQGLLQWGSKIEDEEILIKLK